MFCRTSALKTVCFCLFLSGLLVTPLVASADTFVPRIKILEPHHELIVFDDAVTIEFSFNSASDPDTLKVLFNQEEKSTHFSINRIKGFGRCVIRDLPLGAGIIKISIQGRKSGNASDSKGVSVQKRPMQIAGFYNANSHIQVDALIETIYKIIETVLEVVPDAPEIPAFEDIPTILNGILLDFTMNLQQNTKDLNGQMHFLKFTLELPDKDDVTFEYSGENAWADITGVINEDKRVLFYPFNFVFFPDVGETQKEVIHVIIDAIADEIFKDMDPVKKEELVNMIKKAVDTQIDTGSGFNIEMTGLASQTDFGRLQIEGKMIVRSLILILPGDFLAQTN